jgi:hypothetical protein
METRDPPDASAASAPGSDPQPPLVRTENVFCRNYDPYRRYHLRLAVADPDGEQRFAERYSFRPGQVESVSGVLEAGTYEVTVGLGSRQTKTRSVRVGPAPEHTIHVEVGNGVLSLTEGLYG